MAETMSDVKNDVDKYCLSILKVETEEEGVMDVDDDELENTTLGSKLSDNVEEIIYETPQKNAPTASNSVSNSKSPCFICFMEFTSTASQASNSFETLTETLVEKICNIKLRKTNRFQRDPLLCGTCVKLLRDSHKVVEQVELLQEKLKSFREKIYLRLIAQNQHSFKSLKDITLNEEIRNEVIKRMQQQFPHIKNSNAEACNVSSVHNTRSKNRAVAVKCETITKPLEKQPSKRTLGSANKKVKVSIDNSSDPNISPEKNNSRLGNKSVSKNNNKRLKDSDPEWILPDIESSNMFEDTELQVQQEETDVSPRKCTSSRNSSPRLSKKCIKTENEKPEQAVIETHSKSNETQSKQTKKRRSDKKKVHVKVKLKYGTCYDAQYYRPCDDQQPNNQQISAGHEFSIFEELSNVKFVCTQDKCSTLFSSLDNLNLHLKKVHKVASLPFLCIECEETFSSAYDRFMHMKQHDVNFPSWIKAKLKNICPYADCQQSFTKSVDLENHVRSVHTLEKPFKCEHCDASFSTTHKKESHIEQNHYEIPPFKCDQCPKAFFRNRRLKEHMKSHTGERPYLCEICSQSFSQVAYLRYHQTKHSELALQPYKCDQCSKTFASPINLKIHRNTQHKKVYKYYCDICHVGASHLCHLKLHMRTHSGERPHVCHHCQKTFTRSGQLKIHLRSHTGERPYVCRTCSKTFTNSSKLRRHEVIHQGEKPYKCDSCDKGFTQLSNLKVHTKMAHSEKSEGKSTSTFRRDEGKPEETNVIQTQPVFAIQNFSIPNFLLLNNNVDDEFDADGYANYVILTDS